MDTTTLLRWRDRLLRAALSVLLFVILALQMARPINLAAVDIGRHIKNGEMVLQGHVQVLHTNFYSYTNPDYPFVNHHWLFGVWAYAVWKALGFTGLAAVYILVVLASLWFFWRAARLRGHPEVALFFAYLALPLMFDRREIRPEGFSVLFMGVYYYLLTRLSLGKIRRAAVFAILTALQVVWVNTHIFFFMGPLLVAFFLWEGHSRGCLVCVRSLRPLVLLTLAVCLVNPSGIAGALTPLNIFKGFGYRLAENQNLFFMMSFFPQAEIYGYYLAAVGVLALAMGLAVWLRGWKMNAPFMALAAFIAAAGLRAVRLMTPFGFFLIPLGAFFLGKAEGILPHRGQRMFRAAALGVTVLLAAGNVYALRGQPVALGLAPGVNGSAEFFRQAGIQGPVFSNYDIGGYLIFHLAPAQKVFVDNRQEAFPAEFFQDTYIPMQEKDDVWAGMDARYGFNAIYFYRHDLTPWGQDFMIKRVNDPGWAPVFVDAYTIIFLKRNAQNDPLIRRFELPHSMFGVSNSQKV